MTKTVTCECGWSFTGPEDELVLAIQRHGREVHNVEITHEQALSQARPV